VAPPGIGRADRERLDRTIETMVRSAEWREALARYRWLDRYLGGEPFARFVAAEERRVRDILRQFGTGRDEGAALASGGPYPLFVLAGLVVFGMAALVDVRRHSTRLPEPRWPKVKSAGLIGIGIAIHLALAERAGFVIAAAALFWFTARAFDETRPLRDALFAVIVSIAAYLLFARVLQLPLPAGVLAAWF
jgi:hypothetical protein